MPQPANWELDDVTVDRIADLQDFLANTRENLDLIMLVREALRRIEIILVEMRTLSNRAAQEDLTSEERAALQQKIDRHINEIDQIAVFTEYKAGELIKDENPNPKLH